MTQNHKNSHTIGGLPEKPYSSLTGRPSKKIICPQIILSYNKQNTNKKQHCAGVIGHEQYHRFMYNNYNSHNTIASDISLPNIIHMSLMSAVKNIQNGSLNTSSFIGMSTDHWET